MLTLQNKEQFSLNQLITNFYFEFKLKKAQQMLQKSIFRGLTAIIIAKIITNSVFSEFLKRFWSRCRDGLARLQSQEIF